MADKPKYTKLSRRASSLVSHSQLWKGPDHLLLVKEMGCSEEYKRFYYHDIQAVSTVRSLSYLLWVIVLAVSMLFMTAAYFSVKNEGRLILPWIIGATAGFLIIHLVRGPSCKCWVQTGINKERLIMFKRTAQVRRFLKRIEQDIVSAQGVFSIEEMEAEGTRHVAAPMQAPPVPEI